MQEENHYLPKDTFKTGINHNQIDNFALRLNKFPKSYKKYDKVIRNELTEFGLFHHEKKKGIHCEVNLDFQKSLNKILKFSAKYLFCLERIPNLKVETSYFKPDWRFVIGLGSPSVYETSITLHHIYGFPYIPGQAVKGVTRNYVINEYYENEQEAIKTNDFMTIFGNQEKQGKVTFFDAYPTSEPKFDFDIINVHYPDYYQGKREPTDDQNPNPITFLTVKNTGFAFSIGLEKKNMKN